ncbi:MAG: NAD(P)H-quinone oxidoreductase [Myxococcales bacterium]|jgi:NADPH2:quinone reductase|nr:MAG: NAD(P)H-quinone oxidoreductase [Myxococcales bacterium]
MKAIVIKERGGPEVLVVREIPEPACGPEDLLVRVRATALNRGDLLQRRGLYPQPGPPTEHEVPGLEFAGEVLEIGDRTEGFAAGDRVMGILAGGSYAEKVVAHSRNVARIPDNLSTIDAAAVPEAFITAHDALRQCGLVAGESVLVHAAGSGVGVAAIQIARVVGATPIIGTAGSDAKLDAARELGLDVGINYHTKDFAVEVMRATEGRGADVIVDFIGASYLARNLASVAECGRIIVIGMLGGITAELNIAMLLARRVHLMGTLLRPRPLEQKAAATKAFEKSVLPHLASGAIRAIIDRTFPLEEAAAAHAYMETNANFGKIILEV